MLYSGGDGSCTPYQCPVERGDHHGVVAEDEVVLRDLPVRSTSSSRGGGECQNLPTERGPELQEVVVLDEEVGRLHCYGYLVEVQVWCRGCRAPGSCCLGGRSRQAPLLRILGRSPGMV